MATSPVASGVFGVVISVFAIPLAGLLVACSDMGSAIDGIENFRLSKMLGAKPGEAQVLWQSDGQYVRLESQDPVKKGEKSKNAHPVIIPAQWISGALRLVQVKLTRKSKPLALFTEKETAILGRYLSEGLAEAAPRQDVTFAVTRPSRSGEPLVTTARVFFNDNRLNMIFGSILADGSGYDGNPELYSKYDNPSIKVYSPGNRTISVTQNAILSAPPNSGIFRPAGLNRTDWIVITPQANVVQRPVAQPVRTWPYQQPAQPYQDYYRGPVPRAPVLPPARVRAPTPAPAAVPTSVAPAETPTQTPGYALSPKERLQALKGLFDEGLISKEQYIAKQKEILRDY